MRRTVCCEARAARALALVCLPLLSAFARPDTVSASGGALFPTYPDRYYGAGHPVSVAIGDLNRDGNPDIAVANYVFDTTLTPDLSVVSVMLGHGDGTFGPRTDIHVGDNPFALALEDLNQDGNPDLVVIQNEREQDVSVLLGHGDGTFAPRMAFGVGGYPVAMAIGDLNGDGKLDLVVSDSNPGLVVTLLGHGDGTFGPYVAHPLPPFAGGVAIGDLNGDGKADVVVREGDTGVMLGNGDGTVGDPTWYSTTVNNYYGVAAVDLNGDGLLDVAAGSSVLLGNGDGTLQPFHDFGMDVDAASLVVADLDGDGRLDLACANSDPDVPGGLAVLLGHGDGTFEHNVGYPTGEFSLSVAIGDLNHDGRPDAVLTGLVNNTVSVFLGTETPPLVVGLDLKPHDLNLESKDKWVTAVIAPPLSLPVSQIDVSSLLLNRVVPASLDHLKLQAHENRLTVKFSRSALLPTLVAGDQVPVLLTGLIAGQPFQGEDLIKVKARKMHAPHAGQILAGGAATNVGWDPADIPASTVTLLSSFDDGMTWQIESAGIANTGTTTWSAPAIATSQARLAVVEVYTVDETGVVPQSELAESDPFTISATTGVEGASAELRLQVENPGRGGMTVRFSLASGSVATLAIFDVAGRRVASRDVGSLGAGWHTIRLSQLAPGVYSARLTQSGKGLGARIAIIR